MTVPALRNRFREKRLKYTPNDPCPVVEAVRNINSAVDVRIRPDSFISVEMTSTSVSGEFIYYRAGNNDFVTEHCEQIMSAAK